MSGSVTTKTAPPSDSAHFNERNQSSAAMEVDCHRQVCQGTSITLCMHTSLKDKDASSSSFTDSQGLPHITATSCNRIYECFQKGPPQLISDKGTAVNPRKSNSETLEISQSRERNRPMDGTNLGKSSGDKKDIPGVYFSYQLETDSAIHQPTCSPKHPTPAASYISKGNEGASTSNQSSMGYQCPAPPLMSTSQPQSETFHTAQDNTHTYGVPSPHSSTEDNLTGNGSATVVPQVKTATTGIGYSPQSQLDNETHLSTSGTATTNTGAFVMNESTPSLVVTSSLQTLPLFTTAAQTLATTHEGVSFEEKLLKLLHMQTVEKQKLLSNVALSKSESKQDQTGSSHHSPNTQVEQTMKQQYATIAPKTIETVETVTNSSSSKRVSYRKKTREEKLEYLRKYAKERRARETPNQREARLADLRARQRARKANETEQQRLLRLEKDRIKTLRYRAKKKQDETSNEDDNRLESIGYQNSSTSSAS